MLSKVVLRYPEGWSPSVEVDDEFGKIVRIGLGRAIHEEDEESGIKYVRGLRPCYAVYVRYRDDLNQLPCGARGEPLCPCDSSQYPVGENSPYLGVSCDYSVVTYFDFVRLHGWSQYRSSGCFGGPGNDACGDKFSSLDGVGGEVIISIPGEVLDINSHWFLVICLSEITYVFSGVFETVIYLSQGSEECTVLYEFVKPDNTVGESGVVSNRAYIYPVVGSYSLLRLTPSPSQNYTFEKFQYNLCRGGTDCSGWQDLDSENGEYSISLSGINRGDILYVRANFVPINIEISTDFPIEQGMHLFGGWNLGYLEIINSDVEFYLGVSSFSNLPIGSYRSGDRYQEILTPILVRHKYGLSKFGSIARIKNSSLTFYIPHPLKFYDVYSRVGVYGSCINNVSTNFASGSYISSSLNDNKHLMSLITFVLDDSTGSASESIEFSGCFIKVVKNVCSTNNTIWPHVSYFTLIRKFVGVADAEFSALYYIILPSMFRDNVFTGLFYEEPQGQQGNSALFAAFTGFQFILDNSSKTFFFDLSNIHFTAKADALENNYFVPTNKSLNAIISIPDNGCLSTGPIIIPGSGNTNIIVEGE